MSADIRTAGRWLYDDLYAQPTDNIHVSCLFAITQPCSMRRPTSFGFEILSPARPTFCANPRLEPGSGVLYCCKCGRVLGTLRERARTEEDGGEWEDEHAFRCQG